MSLIKIKKRNHALRLSFGDRVFHFICVFLVTLFSVICLYPILNVVAKAFSERNAVAAAKVGIWPIGFTTDSFAYVIKSSRFLYAIKNTLFVTIVSTLLQLLLTIVMAYAVSRKDFPGGKILMFLYVFSMMFSGGLIPTYLAIKEIGLYDSLWAIIVPSLVNPFYLIIMRNYIDGLPQELEESASIDGASQLRFLVSIITPLLVPSLATIGLFCAVDGWNCYYSATIYLTSRNNVMLQQYLHEILLSVQTTEMSTLGDSALMGLPAECIQCACVVASALPIVIVYPFLQKYYVKGMTLGAVKG